MCRLEVEAYDARVELDKFRARTAALVEHVEERLAAYASIRDASTATEEPSA